PRTPDTSSTPHTHPPHRHTAGTRTPEGTPPPRARRRTRCPTRRPPRSPTRALIHLPTRRTATSCPDSPPSTPALSANRFSTSLSSPPGSNHRSSPPTRSPPHCCPNTPIPPRNRKRPGTRNSPVVNRQTPLSRRPLRNRAGTLGKHPNNQPNPK